MLTFRELRRIGRARLRDAEVLFKANRVDGAQYLCGYAIELYLKARIGKVKGWGGFPEVDREFDARPKKDAKIHDLQKLLVQSGLGIIPKYLTEWSSVSRWNPEMRYNVIGVADKSDVALMLDSTRTLLRVL